MSVSTEEPAEEPKSDSTMDVSTDVDNCRVLAVECRKRCTECQQLLGKDIFVSMEWRRTDGLHFCRFCVELHKQQGVPLRCNHCGVWKCISAFREACRHGLCVTTRACEQCCTEGHVPQRSGARWCSRCHNYLSKDHFKENMWTHSSDRLRRCRACQRAPMGKIRCQTCLTIKSREEYYRYTTNRKECDECSHRRKISSRAYCWMESGQYQTAGAMPVDSTPCCIETQRTGRIAL